jgi:hypothetical protein
MRMLSLRAWFLVAFVIAMPVLALPPVAVRVNEFLYGGAPSDFGQPPAAAPPIAPEVIQPQVAEQDSPASVSQQESGLIRARGLDGVLSPAPPLEARPAFAPLVAPKQPAAPTEVKIDETTLARLQQVRERLEALGAEYVIAEALDGSGEYHFHCRMLVDAQSRFTRPFEATAADPLTAAEQVLRDVEMWYAAAAAAAAGTTRRE